MFGFGTRKAASDSLPDHPSFEQMVDLGVYHPLDGHAAIEVNTLVGEVFSEFAGRIQCFGHDWLGRVFAEDSARGGEVLLLEPGTGEALEIPVDREDFLTFELVQQADAAAAYSFYRQWRDAGNPAPETGQCVGYRKPLFLGGADSVENLELSDLSVYWSVAAQLIAQLRG